MNVTLKCSNLIVVLGKKEVLSNISFEINEGDIVALLGPNGSGKSTLIKSIIGYYRIRRGNIYVNNHDIKISFPNAISLVGVVLNKPDLYKEYTGYQNLEFIASIYDVSDNKIMELVKLLNLNTVINNYVDTYSSGEKKRLMIARALLNEPNILILDEPFNNLDIESINIIKKVIAELKQRKVSILISGHNIQLLKEIANKYMIINNGNLVEYKKIRNIKNLEKKYLDTIEKINKK